jgi:hypothetical protein
VRELDATGRAAQADAILERARSWRLDDADFARRVAAVREPKPAVPRPPVPRPTTTEGTVVLDITDLLARGDGSATSVHGRSTEPVVDLSDDPALEVVDADDEVGGTEELRMKDLWHASREPWRPGTRRPPVRRPAVARESPGSADADDELEEVTLVRRVVTGGVAARVLDERAHGHHHDPRSPSARAAMVRRARPLARPGRAHA